MLTTRRKSALAALIVTTAIFTGQALTPASARADTMGIWENIQYGTGWGIGYAIGIGCRFDPGNVLSFTACVNCVTENCGKVGGGDYVQGGCYAGGVARCLLREFTKDFEID